MELPDYIPISMLNALAYCPRRFWIEFVLGEMLVNEHVLEGQLRHEISDSGEVEHDGTTTTLRRVYVYSDRLRLSGFADLVELIAGEPGPSLPGPDVSSLRGCKTTARSCPADDWPAAPVTAASPSPQKTAPQPRAPVTLVPVEYKKGKMGRWLNDHIQLCAQALCLEERLKEERKESQPHSLASSSSLPLHPSSLNLERGYIFYFGSRRRELVLITPALRQKTEAMVKTAFDLLAKGEMPPPLPPRQAAKCRDCSLEPICLPQETLLLTTQVGRTQTPPEARNKP